MILHSHSEPESRKNQLSTAGAHYDGMMEMIGKQSTVCYIDFNNFQSKSYLFSAKLGQGSTRE